MYLSAKDLCKKAVCGWRVLTYRDCVLTGVDVRGTGTKTSIATNGARKGYSMKSSVWLAVAGLAGTTVLVAQFKAEADPGGSVPVTLAVAAGAIAGGCTSGTGPDVIVGNLTSISKFGTVGTITAYAIGTESCNIGNSVISATACSSGTRTRTITRSLGRTCTA
jgi:hypothetical protein